MPEIFRHGSCVVQVLLPPREHGPAHVHVWCPEGAVVVELDPVSVREIHGDVKAAMVREIIEAINERQEECLTAWRKYHG